MHEHEDYRNLRGEILLRITIQNFILILLMPLLLGAVITSAWLPQHGPVIILAYVGAAGMGALYWIHNAARTVQIKTYLRSLETAGTRGGAGWETWLANNPVPGLLGSRWFISTKGIFVGSQLASILLGALLTPDLVDRPLPLLLALGTSLLTAILLVQPKMAQ